MRRAITTLWPLWAVTGGLTVLHVLVGHDRPHPVQITLVDNAFVALSNAVLPFLAGYLYMLRCKGGLLAAAVAGISIPLADIGGVGIAYVILQAGWLAFAGFLIANAMFSVVPSALFGIGGHWVARRYESRHT